MTIAVAQTIPVRGDVDQNLEQHIRLVQIAAEEGAQVLVFPELSLTGYELDLARELAFAERDPRLTPLIEVASTSSMILIVGAPVRTGSRFHIGAFIISSDRKVELYTKHHLGAFSAGASCDGIVPPAEATVFHPGKRNPLVRFDGNIAAVAVCADTGQRSHPQEAVERSARMYLASMFVIPSEFERETANLRGYSIQHSMTVAFANFGGPSGGLSSAGRSAIWSASGELIAQLDATGAGVAVAIESHSGWRGRTIMVAANAESAGAPPSPRPTSAPG
jgi:predicted amidohydrolase